MRESLSPLPTLARGYTVLRDPTGSVISQAATLTVGQEISGPMQDGRFPAEIRDPALPARNNHRYTEEEGWAIWRG